RHAVSQAERLLRRRPGRPVRPGHGRADRRRRPAPRGRGGGGVRRAALALLALTFAAGCGSPSADLFVAKRAGSIPGARLELSVTDDGHVSCNGGKLVEITSAQLITARDVARELQKPAKQHVALPARPGSTLSYAFEID